MSTAAKRIRVALAFDQTPLSTGIRTELMHSALQLEELCKPSMEEMRRQRLLHRGGRVPRMRKRKQ
jgi:hypothetical protein